MNDDTERTDDWGAAETSSGSAERSAPGEAQAETQAETPGDTARVGFCQDCGKPLTREALRTVGTGVFCEPCLTTRVGSTAPPSGYTTVPPYSAIPPQPGTTNDPSPVLAAILGLIPGVGAMYNGQFAKGIVHLAIFAVLVSLSDNVNGIFGLFVAGWVFYMAFEAYHTAIARRDGLPLPNAFGFNDIGERMGFGKSWSPAKAGGSSASQAPYSAPPTANPVAGPGYAPVNPVPVGTAPDWVGYVPPTAFGSHAAAQEATAASMAAQAQAAQNAGYAHAPYAETYTGAAPTYSTTVPPAATPAPEIPARRFPAGAIWLIGLGVLILAANLLPDWKLTAQWWAPAFFAGLSIWLFTRRLRTGAKLVCIIRWPVILMVLAVILALHAAYVPVTIGLTASILLIAFGALLLLERTAGAAHPYETPIATPMYPGNPYSGTTSAAGVQPGETPQRAAWVAPDSDVTSKNPDDTKGGQ
jgi:TM2 domain-containing membrane protein YozV